MGDWLVVWGVSQVAWFVFKPVLEELAVGATQDWIKDFFKDSLTAVTTKDPLIRAAGQAVNQVTLLFYEQLKYNKCDLSKHEIKGYTPDLKRFVGSRQGKKLLGGAFRGELDPKRLAEHWERLRLRVLPNEFNWQRVCEDYDDREQLQRYGLDDHTP